MDGLADIDWVGVGTGFAIAIAAVFAWFGNKSGKKRTTDIEVAGAIVDNSATSKLAESVKDHAKAIREATRQAERLTEAVDDHTVEVRLMREEMIRKK